MRVVLVGGGSGGHFYPLIAIAEALRAREVELNLSVDLYYMGPDIFDQPELGRLGISFVRCPAGKVRRYFSLQNLIDPFKTLLGFLIALMKLFWIYPDVIMSKGSFTSVPVVIAAWILRIPIVLHESDAVPGRANKLAQKFARYVAITYPDTAAYFPSEKVALTGAPVRTIFYTEADTRILQSLQIDPSERFILFLTGSLGAQRLNEAILSSLDELLPHYKIVHQAGDRNLETVTIAADALITSPDLRIRYHPLGNISGAEMHTLQSYATLIVSRAGSGTIAEIAMHQKPAILVPIPEVVSHDQRRNAFAYARTGGALVMEEHNITDNLLVAEIDRIVQDTETQNQMRRGAASFFVHHAAYALADTIISIAREHAK